jgi:hypothetical protein
MLYEKKMKKRKEKERLMRPLSIEPITNLVNAE